VNLFRKLVPVLADKLYIIVYIIRNVDQVLDPSHQGRAEDNRKWPWRRQGDEKNLCHFADKLHRDGICFLIFTGSSDLQRWREKIGAHE
jgi:hypothetical protein